MSPRFRIEYALAHADCRGARPDVFWNRLEIDPTRPTGTIATSRISARAVAFDLLLTMGTSCQLAETATASLRCSRLGSVDPRTRGVASANDYHGADIKVFRHAALGGLGWFFIPRQLARDCHFKAAELIEALPAREVGVASPLNPPGCISFHQRENLIESDDVEIPVDRVFET